LKYIIKKKKKKKKVDKLSATIKLSNEAN